MRGGRDRIRDWVRFFVYNREIRINERKKERVRKYKINLEVKYMNARSKTVFSISHYRLRFFFLLPLQEKKVCDND